MSCLSDLTDLTDDERMALCQELGRLTRIVPLSSIPAGSPSISPDAGESAGVGDSDKQGAMA